MKPPRHTRPGMSGFSLIELIVAMVIGLVLTLAISSVLIRSEGSKRSSTSVNDLNQTGAYAAFVLDRAVRSAGSGFSQRWGEVYGCRLDVSQGAVPTRVLPMPAAIPASSAFTRLPQVYRLAPVIIGKGLADIVGLQVRGDVLISMGGTAGMGESAHAVIPASVTANDLRLQNTLGYRTGDLILLSDTAVAAGCMMQQVTFPGGTEGGAAQLLPLAGQYFSSTGTNVNLANFGASTISLQMGNAANNPPQFTMYGVGDNNTLMSYDLLLPSAPDVPIADGVVEMRAVYGLDTSAPPDGTLDTWIDPSAAGFTAAALMDGSAASRARLRQIVAVRLGFILRTSLDERAKDFAPAATDVTLFGDLPADVRQTRTLSAAEQRYRFRTVEITVPLRNVLLAPAL